MNIIDALRRLEPSGFDGFEGLIAKLLSSLTEQHFRLARSGSQMGRDMHSRELAANVIAVECKRYKEDTQLDTRELLGELTELKLDIPDIDLWVLVASRNVDSRLFETLEQAAEMLDIAFVCISTNDGTPSSLEVLCASASHITLNYLRPHCSEKEIDSLNQELATIARLPGFSAMCQKLRMQLQSPWIGYASWRATQNHWFINCVQSQQVSRTAFKQVLDVGDQTTKLVERIALWNALDKWLMEWNRQRSTFIILGEEGDGKTWGVASWLHHRLEKEPSFPAVIFIASLNANSNIPNELLVTTTATQAQIHHATNWQSRLTRWLMHQPDELPVALLVLDGINEHRSFDWWRQLLESLVGEKSFENIAIIVTCRTGYWERTMGNFDTIPTIEFILPSFSDDELRQALKSNQVNWSGIPSSLHELIHKPRYFDLVLKHRSRLSQTGDLTPARLIYEDWLDRLRRKTNIPLNDEQFRNLLRNLAEKYLSSGKLIKDRDLNTLLPERLDHQNLLEELRTGGVLKGTEGRYKVDERQLALGLGLLLVDELLDTFEMDPDSNLTEVGARWLEPKAGIDIKARICEVATLHALEIPGINQKVKLALLRFWLDSQNPGQEIESTLTAYVPVDPDCYIQLSELVWSENQENRWAQELLMRAFLRWYTISPVVAATLDAAFARWLSIVHIFGHPFQRGANNEKIDTIKWEIQERLGYELTLGPFVFAGRKFLATEDDGLLRLGRVALAVISHLPREQFIPSIATACVAEAIMGRPEKYDLFRWVLSSAPVSVWPTVYQEVQKLLVFDSIITAQAAHRLLSFEGSKHAYEFQQILPQDMFPQHPKILEILKNPCTSGFAWNRADCENCLRQNDLTASYIARQIKPHCIDPDLDVPPDIGARLASLTESISVTQIWSTIATGGDDHTFESYEPALCAYAPDAIADLVRRIVRQTHKRQGLALRQISFRLREYALLFEQDEMQSIYQAWIQLNQSAELEHEEQAFAEMFLFGMILQCLDAEAQVEHLLKRPEIASDLLSYKYLFLPVENWSKIKHLLNEISSNRNLCRILWFISAHSKTMPTELLNEYIVPFVHNDNSVVRSCALDIIHNAEKAEVANPITSLWTWHPDNHEDENHWGSLLLCKYGQSLTFSELSQRIHPLYLGYAVRCRGLDPNEVNLFAEEIHKVWSRLKSTSKMNAPKNLPLVSINIDEEKSREIGSRNLTGLVSEHSSHKIRMQSRYNSWGGNSQQEPTDWHLSLNQQVSARETRDRQIVSQVRQEQIDVGNFWFARRFYEDSLEKVVTQRPDLLEQWLDLDRDNKYSNALLNFSHSFYEALCIVLLQHSLKQGIYLYSKLACRSIFLQSSRSHWRLLDVTLFNVTPCSDIAEVWTKKLYASKTDLELLYMASLAQNGNASEWLWSFMDQHCDSEAPLEKSLAITMLGFYDRDVALKRLNGLSDTVPPNTWIGQLVQVSLRRWKMNDWAKSWFQKMFTVDRTEDAWASFRLFLACVDSRFWIWWQQIQTACSHYPAFEHRKQFIDSNLEPIRNRIRKNEKTLEEHLYGQKVMHNQAWPWIV